MKWEIRYYMNEFTYQIGAVAFKETMTGDRNFVVNYAQNRVRGSFYKFFEIIPL